MSAGNQAGRGERRSRPIDDGACRHLYGKAMPRIELDSTDGGRVDVGDPELGGCVFFFYPMTRTPGVPLPEDWEQIPGASGCTAESCAYRDTAERFRALGFTVFGVSSQELPLQKEFALREHINYPLLNDSLLELAGALHLPTFVAKGAVSRLVKRLTIVTRSALIVKVFYPVFPPENNAAEVLSYLLDSEKEERTGK